jgi:L-lactate dehydrogenase complex protein LldG
MTARADILSNIRRSLGVTGHEAPRLSAVADRLAQAPRGLMVARGNGPREQQIAVFREQALATLATLAEVDSAAEVPAAVADYLRSNNLPARIRMGEDPRLAAMPWAETALEIGKGRSDGKDLAGVNHAFGAVAETGTMVMVSGADNPTTLNFLPDYAIVVLRQSDVAGDYETVWSRLRETYGKGVMPRTVNWITGPSRSADIEQTLLLGAHGPRSLHIVMIRD